MAASKKKETRDPVEEAAELLARGKVISEEANLERSKASPEQKEATAMTIAQRVEAKAVAMRAIEGYSLDELAVRVDGWASKAAEKGKYKDALECVKYVRDHLMRRAAEVRPEEPGKESPSREALLQEIRDNRIRQGAVDMPGEEPTE